MPIEESRRLAQHALRTANARSRASGAGRGSRPRANGGGRALTRFRGGGVPLGCSPLDLGCKLPLGFAPLRHPVREGVGRASARGARDGRRAGAVGRRGVAVRSYGRWRGREWRRRVGRRCRGGVGSGGGGGGRARGVEFGLEGSCFGFAGLLLFPTSMDDGLGREGEGVSSAERVVA